MKVTATFSNGQTRDVTDLAAFDPSNLNARVSRDGVVRRQTAGEVAVLVRYLDRQATAQVAFVPDRPGFVWHDLPANNFVDLHLYAKLRTCAFRSLRLWLPTTSFCGGPTSTLWACMPTADEARAFLSDQRLDKPPPLDRCPAGAPEFARVLCRRAGPTCAQ